MPIKKTTGEKKTKADSKPKAISPFDIIKLMFENQEEFWKIPADVLSRNYFMINERMSIQFPLQAAVFNHLKINPGEVVKCWATFIMTKGLFGKTPGYIFIQGKKKAAETNLLKRKKYPEDFLQEFSWYHKISIRDTKFLLDACPIETYKMLDEFDDMKKELEKLKSLTLSSMKDTSEDE